MVRDARSQPDNRGDGVAGQFLVWELTLPGMSDRFWGARWGRTRSADSLPGSPMAGGESLDTRRRHPTQEQMGEADTLEAGQQLAEALERGEVAEAVLLVFLLNAP
ncbi:MAG: hypothetical protein J2P57_14950 [Acidimicrobiaceae bacterium]|nr:hypothetical protein [Acidimicrobiaceae bacterium]